MAGESLMDDAFDVTTGWCRQCGARVPLEFLPEHLAEHDLSITADKVRKAPIVDLTEDAE